MPALNRVIAVGSSTGGIDALQVLFAGLPADLPASVLVVNHTGADSPNILDRILRRVTDLPVTNARDLEPMKPAHVYIALANHHLTVNPHGQLRVTHGPRENRVRPAIDPLFRSIAAVYAPKAVGVLLTGHLDDGTAGLWAVRERGGVTVVQNPEEAAAPAMPLNAIKHVEVNHVLKLEQIAPLLARLAEQPVKAAARTAVPENMAMEINIANEANALESGITHWGDPSVFTCPECHGVLLQQSEGSNLRFRCHTGHAYSLETLLSELTKKNEDALWNAIRVADETVLLLNRMAGQLEARGEHARAVALRGRARHAQTQSNAVRQALFASQRRDERRRR